MSRFLIKLKNSMTRDAPLQIHEKEKSIVKINVCLCIVHIEYNVCTNTTYAPIPLKCFHLWPSFFPKKDTQKTTLTTL